MTEKSSIYSENGAEALHDADDVLIEIGIMALSAFVSGLAYAAGGMVLNRVSNSHLGAAGKCD